jgi:hypothetical protein
MMADKEDLHQGIIDPSRRYRNVNLYPSGISST